MARTLPPGLAAKISAAGQQPELSLTVQDLQTRLSLFASGGTAGRSSALVSSTGKILRAVCTQSGATNQAIAVQRITPGTFSSWTAAGTGVTGNAIARAGCCLVQTGSTTRLFYQRSSDNLICYRDSTDDGVTWGAEQVTVATVPTAMLYCYGIAADTTTSLHTEWAAFDPAGVCGIYRTAYSGSWAAWSAVGPATPAYGGLRGLAVTTVSGTRRFVCGMGMRGYTSGISAAWFTWNGASTYSGASAIQSLDSPSQGLSLSYPDIFYDSSNLYGDARQWYATVLLTDDGSVSTSAHTRTTLYRSSDGSTWAPWLNAGTSLQYGAHVLVTGGVLYLFDATTCYTIPAVPAPVDLTNDVLSLSIKEVYGAPAGAEIVLSNQNGQYSAASWLVDNATLTLAYGYSGQTVTTHLLSLDDWSLQANADSATLTLACRGPLKLLDYPLTQQLVYQNQPLAQILTSLMQAAGMRLAALPGTAPFSQQVSCFIVTPGETWLSALSRLATLYNIIVRADATPEVVVCDPQATDPSTWTYGSELLATEYGQESNRPNVVRVTGATSGTTTAWSEATDPANILLVGSERFLLMVDRMLDTSARCQIRAQQELRQVQRASVHGAMVCAPNPQHELADVITYSDSAIGVSNATMRISAITTTLAPSGSLW